MRPDGTTGYGSVDYLYQIGKYEVTNAQYCAFLNAIAATDTYSLYNTNMAGTYGGIQRDGSADGYSYSVKPAWENKPVNFVSWYDALRFANWLHNGQPTGLQDNTTTEDGAYMLTGQHSVAPGDHPIHGANGRNADARIWLTGEDEWYKAAYYKGGCTNAGYWDYATQSDTLPDHNWPDGDSGNSANYHHATESPYLTDVGAYSLSESAYGTFDQTGNVYEWDEGLFSDSIRVVRGGAWDRYDDAMPACFRNGSYAHHENANVGFRVASLPEPPCEPDMVFIPGGEFEMGDHFGEGNADELPVHAVYISSFYMSRHEITNQQYCDYLNSAYDACDIKVDGGIVYASSDSSNSYPYCDTHGYDADSQIDYSGGLFSVRSKGGRNMSNDPMVEVSWYGAVAYCDFYGYRLPTEAEWEYAARGGLSGKRFPWGDTISHSQANYKADPSGYPYDVNPTSGFHPDWDDGIYPYTAPIGSFASNGYGLYDMGGNVWEWCNDWYDSNYYGVSPYDNPQGPPSGIYRILRGGTGHINADECRVADRGTYVPDRRYVDRGFRVARDAEPPEPVAFWPFDGDANDASGNGHDGTVHGATLCEDRCLVRDSAYCFDGEDDYIQVADAPLLDIDSDMTISAWVEPSEFDGNFFILWKHHYVISHVNDAYGLRITATDEVAFHFGPNSHETTSGYGLQRGHWTHVAVTFDDATDELIFYKNGQFHQRVSTSRSINTNNSPLFIQGFYHHESGWNCFPGTVDELRIYDRALSACEIHELIENCSPIAHAGGPYIEYATSWFGADVGLDGTNSNDPDGDAITYEWELDLSVDSDGDGDPCNDVDATDPAPESFFPIGQTDIALVVIDEHGLRSERDTTNVTVSFIEVAIDIKPGSFPNAINMGSNGVVPVAFLTDLGFDASTVDPATVTLRGEDFADGLVKLRGKKDAPAPMASLEDVDADGDLDLVVHLETEKLAEQELQAICEIGALTYDGYVVSGSDTIHVVPE
jgi:formylglycine-generating enzyme required for sulfatase activity